ncbi:hypothetical protein KIPB_004827, partial [Kipferlia bialata]|eukprot:g4827.t1
MDGKTDAEAEAESEGESEGEGEGEGEGIEDAAQMLSCLATLTVASPIAVPSPPRAKQPKRGKAKTAKGGRKTRTRPYVLPVNYCRVLPREVPGAVSADCRGLISTLSMAAGEYSSMMRHRFVEQLMVLTEYCITQSGIAKETPPPPLSDCHYTSHLARWNVRDRTVAGVESYEREGERYGSVDVEPEEAKAKGRGGAEAEGEEEREGDVPMPPATASGDVEMGAGGAEERGDEGERPHADTSLEALERQRLRDIKDGLDVDMVIRDSDTETSPSPPPRRSLSPLFGGMSSLPPITGDLFIPGARPGQYGRLPRPGLKAKAETDTPVKSPLPTTIPSEFGLHVSPTRWLRVSGAGGCWLESLPSIPTLSSPACLRGPEGKHALAPSLHPLSISTDATLALAGSGISRVSLDAYSCLSRESPFAKGAEGEGGREEEARLVIGRQAESTSSDKGRIPGTAVGGIEAVGTRGRKLGADPRREQQ